MIPDFKTYIGESAWGDMMRRCSGEDIRTEDDVNLLDGERFCEYLKSRYDCDMTKTNTGFNVIKIKREFGCIINIPLFAVPCKDTYDQASFTYYTSENSVGFGCSSRKYCRIFLDLLADRFNSPSIVVEKTSQYIKGDITNKLVIEMIDFVLDNIKNPVKAIISRV